MANNMIPRPGETRHADTNDGFAGKPTAEEQRALDKVYDRNAATPLPPPTRKGDFYSFDLGVSVVDRRSPELSSVLGMDTAQREPLRSTAAELGRIGLPDVLVAQIVDGHIDALLAGARVQTDTEAEADEVALARQIQAHNEELRDKFAKQYGVKDGERLLERTQRFVRSHPKLAAILKQNGLGSRPAIVEAVAAHVFSTGWR